MGNEIIPSTIMEARIDPGSTFTQLWGDAVPRQITVTVTYGRGLALRGAATLSKCAPPIRYLG